MARRTIVVPASAASLITTMAHLAWHAMLWPGVAVSACATVTLLPAGRPTASERERERERERESEEELFRKLILTTLRIINAAQPTTTTGNLLN
jgi:hypothetical protein